MKIAIVTNDGKTVFPHFGMARSYIVYEIENGKVKSKEMRPKAYHLQHPHEEEGFHDERKARQIDAEHLKDEDSMLSNISDCQLLIAGGMGQPMYDRLLSHGIRPYLTNLRNIEDIINTYLDGKLDELKGVG